LKFFVLAAFLFVNVSVVSAQTYNLTLYPARGADTAGTYSVTLVKSSDNLYQVTSAVANTGDSQPNHSVTSLRMHFNNGTNVSIDNTYGSVTSAPTTSYWTSYATGTTVQFTGTPSQELVNNASNQFVETGTVSASDVTCVVISVEDEDSNEWSSSCTPLAQNLRPGLSAAASWAQLAGFAVPIAVGSTLVHKPLGGPSSSLVPETGSSLLLLAGLLAIGLLLPRRTQAIKAS
jgi:hypothetical protein